MTFPHKILLVLPRKGEGFIFPQGKIEDGETPEYAARRELREELGLRNDQIFVQKVVGRELHQIPEERWVTAGCRMKDMTFVEVRVAVEGVRVANDENWSAVWVRSWDEFVEYTNGSRPDKQILMLRALHTANIWPSHGGARQLLGVEPEPLMAVV